MTSDLRAQARERSTRPADQSGPPAARAENRQRDPGATVTGAVLRGDIGPDPEAVPVTAALRRLMRRVRAIAKSGSLPVGEGSRTVPFRGITQLLDAIGPALREFGIFVVPVATETERTAFKTAKGGLGVSCTATVTYRIYGPADDYLEVISAGEANDYGDRAVTKATRIAYRNMWYDLLGVPTEADPEEEFIERATITPADYAQEIMSPGTSLGRLSQIGKDVMAAHAASALVDTPAGEMTLGALGQLVTAARKEKRDPFPGAAIATDEPAGEPE